MQRTDGNESETIAALSALSKDAETDSERAVLLLGQAGCYCRLKDFAKTFEILRSARQLSQTDRLVLSQVALAEASAHAFNDQCELACTQYFAIKSEYKDLLAADEEFSVELDSRLACALVQVGRNQEAIKLFEQVIDNPKVEKQWIQLYFGAALASIGDVVKGREHLFAAAKGHNATWSRSALEYLSAIEGTQ